jgi:hypothetical protein
MSLSLVVFRQTTQSNNTSENPLSATVPVLFTIFSQSEFDAIRQADSSLREPAG